MTSLTGHQIIKTHIYSNILQSKSNQAMRFGQLIEMFFLKNHTQKLGGKISLMPFNEKVKLSISLDQQSEIF